MEELSDRAVQRRSERFDPVSILLIETCRARAIEIDYRAQLSIPEHRDHQFRPACGIAGNMAGEGVNILHKLRRATLRGGPADTLTEGNPDARRPSDEGAKHQFSVDDAVKTRPIELWQKLPHQRGDIGHIGHAVRLTVDKGFCRLAKLSVAFRLAQIGIGFEIIHGTHLARRLRLARPDIALGSQGHCPRPPECLFLAFMSTRRKILLWILAILLVLAGLLYWLTRGDTAGLSVDAVTGTDPVLEEPSSEAIPTVNIAEPIGWQGGEMPTAAEGLEVKRFAEGLDHPRVLQALPNGDILVTLTRSPKSEEEGGLTAWIADWLMTRAGATGDSANQLVLLRDTDGDGVSDERHVLTDKLDSPSGIAFHEGVLYVANHNALVSFPYELGATSIAAEPAKLMDLPPGGGHWMRNIEISPDGRKIYIAVGSVSNIGEQGMEIEKGRAAIHEYTIESGSSRLYATGLRNPNGLDFNPWNGELWTTVNERDMLGSDLVPDYLTNVPLGANYGWPWFYYGDVVDRRVKAPMPQSIVSYTRTPEYALGPHVAALGFRFTRGGHRMGDGFASGAFIARHGSWNRKPASGYDVVFVSFDERGNPQGKPLPVLTDFLAGDGKTRGRPTWVEWAQDGALLVTDDTAGIIWRVIAPGAAPASAIERVETGSLPPQRELRGDPRNAFSEEFARENPMPLPAN